jgi:hypothetical protein
MENDKVVRYEKYMNGLNRIYSSTGPYPCMGSHKVCGWPAKPSELPLLVVAVGTEASGHQMWSIIVQTSVFDCVWVSISGAIVPYWFFLF